MSDYSLKLTIRNNRLLKAIEAEGFKSQAEFARAWNLSPTVVNAYVAMREAPIGKEGRLKQAAREICDALCALPEDLWNEQQLYSELRRSTFVVEASAQDLHKLTENKLYLRQLMDRSKLTERQLDVLDLRFFKEKTIEETGEIFDLSKGRILQIEHQGLRKLRETARLVEHKTQKELEEDYKKNPGLINEKRLKEIMPWYKTPAERRREREVRAKEIVEQYNS